VSDDRKTEKSKGDKLSISDVVVKANKSVNDHDLVNINDIRKSKSLKAQSKVKQLLKINDSSSDDEYLSWRRTTSPILQQQIS
jgi:hypothetical protein